MNGPEITRRYIAADDSVMCPDCEIEGVDVAGDDFYCPACGQDIDAWDTYGRIDVTYETYSGEHRQVTAARTPAGPWTTLTINNTAPRPRLTLINGDVQ